ncbi:YpzI family protein [Bacillus sp. FJAT-45037]|nr:YpzI family protein [Bacillus sp. FJAT-45037]
MGKDRQERKLKQTHQVESDRDQSLSNKGASKLQSPQQAKENQRP